MATPDFGWIAGHWCLEAGGELIEEYWLPGAGDLMLGLSRTVKAGKTASFEYLRIQSKDGVTNYLAQPQGAPPTAFRLAARGRAGRGSRTRNTTFRSASNTGAPRPVCVPRSPARAKTARNS